MKFLRPVAVTEAILTGGSVPENDYPVWSGSITYAAGDRVIRTHRIYESAVAGNVGVDPASGGSAWIDIGPTNRWAMFDQAPATRTTGGNLVSVFLAAGVPIDAVALLDVDASWVIVTVTVDGTQIYTAQQSAVASGVLRSAVTFLDLPTAPSAQINIKALAATGGTASVGTALIGTVTDLGTTESGPTLSLTDFSRRETDDFGVTTVVERAWAKRVTTRSLVDSAAVDSVQRQLAAVRATPVLWIGESEFEALTVYGFYKDFSLDLQLGTTSYCSLTIEGLPTADLPIAATDPAVSGVSDLRVVRPIAVTPTVLTASSVVETDYPEWSDMTVYAAGDRVLRTPTHQVFESLISANIDNDPAAGGTEWLTVGPTNRWAMFDQALGSATVALGQIEVTLMPGEPVTALALLDVAAATIRVQAPGYDRTLTPGAAPVTFLDLATAAADAITVTITATDSASAVTVGTLLVGTIEPLGVVETSPTVSIADFSRKETDDFGVTLPIERAWAKRMAVRSLVASASVDGVFRRIASLRAVPALWIGQGGVESLTIYGFFRDATIEIGQAISTLSLTVEGLSTAATPPAYPLGVQPWPDIPDPDGTKPDDNADVTGDNTSKDTNAVGGRASSIVLATVDTNVEGILAQALRQDDLLQVFDARTLVEGQPVGVVFLSFRDAQQTENAAVATSLSLIGAKNEDGTAWNLNLDTVRAGPVTLGATFASYTQSISALGLTLADLSVQQGVLATSLQELGADYGVTKATVTTLEQAFASESAAVATSLALLGAATPDGNGWALNLANVLVGPVNIGARLTGFDTSLSGLSDDLGDLSGQVGALSTNLEELGADYGGTKATVTDLEEAFATDAGGYARFSIMGKVDPGTGSVSVVGVSGIATAATSELSFVADNFNFVRDDGGSPIKLLTYNGALDRWEFTSDVYAKKIVAGAIDGEFMGVSQLLNPSAGYQTLPGGFIIQWGQIRETLTGGAKLVTFPIPFPNALMAVNATPFVNAPAADQDMWVQINATRSNTSFEVLPHAGPSGQTLNGFDWMAFGK